MRYVTVLGLLILVSVSAFGQVTDPNIMVGAYGSTCPTGCSGDPNKFTTAGFTLFSNGNDQATIPWYILLAIPTNGVGEGSAPVITSSGFTISGGVDADVATGTTGTVNDGDFGPSTSGDIYAFASAFDGGYTGDNSMNATNMFGAAEQEAFGSKPTSFEIWVYKVSTSLPASTNVNFSATLSMGTFVAALGIGGANGTTQFSTPFTTAGLESAPDGGVTLMLLGGVLVGVETLRRRLRV